MKTEDFAPIFEELGISAEEKYLIEPFFTNLERPVFAVTFLPPEVIGALCSRASRAKDDLRIIFLKEFVKPFLEEGGEYGKALGSLIDFLHQHPFEVIFSNPKGREFYIKWLAQYGDDSIAQMAGTHLAFSGISQVAIKHIEDMRIGIAPIEKSTRYVDYSSKVNNRYRYYIDPTFEVLGLKREFAKAMDNLFETYTRLSGVFLSYLKQKHPDMEELVLKAKTFDSLRGLLPTATLSQVAFFGNGQAFEYLANRSLDNSLGEVRWLAERAVFELRKIIPAFLRRIDDEPAKDYRRYLSERSQRIRMSLDNIGWKKEIFSQEKPTVSLIDYDPDGENKIIAALIYPELGQSFDKVLENVRKLSLQDKETILEQVFKDRKARWYRVPRAFENVYLRFEIVMNIGAWRDLHRHRMLTQFRQKFTAPQGFDVPEELEEAGLKKDFVSAVLGVEDIFGKIEKQNPDLAQYCCALAHRLRFLQYQNLRAFFWESELRTIPQGHPDYRKIEQEKARIVKKIYPLLGKYLLADMESYDFARRQVSEQTKKKEEELKGYFDQRSNDKKQR